MWQIMLYTLGVSTALSLAGLCEEKLSAMLGRSRRLFWAMTMALSILWPLGAMLWARPVAVTVPIAPPTALQQPAAIPAEPATVTIAAPRGAESRASVPAQGPKLWTVQPPPDRILLWAWGSTSGVLLLCLAGTDLFLHFRASRWRRQTVLGQPVQISETTGPALLGAWHPTIVLPRWFLDEPAEAQSLILEHEQQHIAARDPLLLRLALLIVAAVPWNLPLWWQLRRLRQAIELDCDARVLRTGADVGSYGAVLLAVTQRAGNVPAVAIAMGEPLSALERRIRHLTTGPARYSAPLALVAVLFWGVGIGMAFALEAPLQQQQGPLPIAVEAAAAARSAPMQLPMLAAAQTAPLPVSGAMQPAARSDGAQALPRLRPPTAVSTALRGNTDPRSRKGAEDAVQDALAARPDLQAAITSDLVINTVKHVIAFMSEDGKVDRFYVRNDPIPLNDMAYGNGTSTGLGGIVPEFLARQWEPLGLQPQQLGQMGFTFLQPDGHETIVHYAWPRRPGEPLGGYMPADSWIFRTSFTYADSVAVLEHFLPGALREKGTTTGGTPWLLLSPQGEVVNSGYSPSNKLLPLIVIARGAPGSHVDYYMGMSVGRRVGERAPDQVVLGWLSPDAPASP